jgi:hypothetical protein
MTLDPEEIRKILNRDPLAEAEQVTGRSYKDSKFTSFIGLQNHLEATADRQQVMLETGDTFYGDTLDRYMLIAKGIGFEIVLDIPFVNPRDKTQNHFFILWNNEILLCFDTWNGDKVNGGKFYYNWIPKSKEYPRLILSSGSWETPEMDLWSGDHDCREALKFKISELNRYGSFLPEWKKQPYLWLIHYGDEKDVEMNCGDNWKMRSHEYKNITKDRINMLPEHVIKAISS